MKKILAFPLLLCLWPLGSPAQITSSDATLLAENCQICHGLMGAGSGEVPGIAGHTPEYMLALLTSLRSGEVQSTIMARLLKPLTEAEISALAAELATWK